MVCVVSPEHDNQDGIHVGNDHNTGGRHRFDKPRNNPHWGRVCCRQSVMGKFMNFYMAFY